MARDVAGRIVGALVAAFVATALLPLASPAVADTVGIEVTDDGFAPTAVTVAPGDTVQWTWTGDGQHGVRAQSGEFDSHPNCSQLTPLQCGGPGATYSHEVAGPARTINYTDPVTGAAGRIVVAEPQPSPSPSPSGEPSPSEEPSPSPSEEPSQEPSASPSPSQEPRPTPSSSPTPDPTPSPTRSTFGPPPPRETAPPVVVSPTETTPAAPATRAEPSLEPFPSFDPALGSEATGDATDDLGSVTIPDDDDPLRTPSLVVAGVALVATLGAFGRLVLFGPPW